MTAQTWVALGAALLAAIVSVTVPLLTFRTTILLEHRRWVRDKRAELYLDLLVEGVAEYEPFRVVKPRPERIKALASPADVRARLGARLSMYASAAVREAWLNYEQQISVSRPPRELGDEQRSEMQEKIYEHFEKVETAIRREMGASTTHEIGR